MSRGAHSADPICFTQILEYDGGVHRDSLADDNRRQNRLINSGYRLLRFTAGDIYQTPDSVVDQVRWALGERRP
jgi:very-short-patch-repair endonuclease